MIGKNVEKLVLSYRITAIAAILAVLVFTTVSHVSGNNLKNQESSSSLSNTSLVSSSNSPLSGNISLATDPSLIASLDTIDFSSVLRVEVPVVGKISSSTEPAEDELEQSLRDLIGSTSGVSSLRASLLEKRAARLAEEAAAQAAREAEVGQAAVNTSAYYGAAYSGNSNSASSTSSSSSSNSSSSSAASSSTTSSNNSSASSKKSSNIDYNKVVYVDDNGEAIDSNPGGAIPVPDNSSDSSTDDATDNTEQ